jgi:hypothetical protein
VPDQSYHMMATGGSIPPGSHGPVPMQVDSQTMPTPCHQRQVPPVPTPAEQGLKRTTQFLQEAMAVPLKQGRRENALKQLSLEKERKRVIERRRKHKERLKLQITELQAIETKLSEIDAELIQLKYQTVPADADD